MTRRHQGLNLLRRVLTALRELPDLGGDDGKATSVLAGARGFDRGIEGEQVRLRRDLADGGDALGDAVHGAQGVMGRLADLLGVGGAATRQRLRILTRLGVPPNAQMTYLT